MRKNLCLLFLVVILLVGCTTTPKVDQRATSVSRAATSEAEKLYRRQTQTAAPTRSSSSGSSSSSVKSAPAIPSCSVWENTTTSDPIAWSKGTGRINVYGGVDEPRTTDVKGTIDPGAAFHVECKSGSYYRVQGVDWWGWLKSTNIEW